MNKETYLKEIQSLNEQIQVIKQKKIELKNNFIKSNTEFLPGDKVEITKGNNTKVVGFVDKIDVTSKGLLDYTFLRIKKDGTPSKHNLPIFLNKGMVKID